MDQLLARIGEIGILPVVRIEGLRVAQRAVALAQALARGGLPAAEITFRTEAAAEAIRAIAGEVPEVLVGAGTVTSVSLVDTAAAAGARFVVCPGWDDEVVERCLELGLCVLPGVAGPDGLIRAQAKGLSTVKFFPAEAAGGIAMLEALAGPFGSMRFVPTGGIDAANVGAYARLRQVLAVGGSWMVKSELVAADDWAGIESQTSAAVRALHGFEIAGAGLACRGVDGADCSQELASALGAAFGLALTPSLSSIGLGGGLEALRSAGGGTGSGPGSGPERGYIALRCNDVERALAALKLKGILPIAKEAPREGAKLGSALLDLQIGGWSLKLVRAL